MLDYVPFHFGPRNIFLFNLKTNYVQGLEYTEGQGPLLTLVISAEAVMTAGHGFVFYDGHALDAFSTCYDDPTDLQKLDWSAIDGNRWPRTEPELKRCKQAEFMVHEKLPWADVRGIAVCDGAAKARVDAIQAGFPPPVRKSVVVKSDWYF